MPCLNSCEINSKFIRVFMKNPIRIRCICSFKKTNFEPVPTSVHLQKFLRRMSSKGL